MVHGLEVMPFVGNDFISMSNVEAWCLLSDEEDDVSFRIVKFSFRIEHMVCKVLKYHYLLVVLELIPLIHSHILL